MTTMTAPPPHVGARASAGYALGSLVTGSFSTVPGLLLLPYLTDTLGVAAGLAGLLAFVPKAWNLVLNPVAGRVSDRTRSRFGPRRPFILVAGLGVAVAFAVMFAGPADGAVGVAWVALGYVVLASAFAFFQAPYAAMPAELTSGYGERTRLMSWRVAGIAVAVLMSGALAPAVVRTAGGGLAGHRAMGVAVGGLVAVGAVAVFLSTRGLPLAVASASEPSLGRQLAVARRNAPFRMLLVIVTVQSAATGALLAGVVYVAQHVLDDPGATTALLLAYTVPAVLLLPVLARARAGSGSTSAPGTASGVKSGSGPSGSRAGWDKRAGVLVSSLVFVAASLAWLVAPAGGRPLVLALAVLIGCANAVQDTFVLAMLPDCIDADTLRTGRRQAGVFAGLFSGGQGLGFAVGPLVFGLWLQLAGYLPSDTGVAAAQSGSTTAAVLIGFALLPAALTALSLIAVARYPRRAGA